MVPPPASETPKLPPVSYADRAKQGQKPALKAPPSNSQSSQRVQKDSVIRSPATTRNGSSITSSDASPAPIDSPQSLLTKQVDHPSPSPPKLSSEPSQNDVKIEQADLSGPLPHTISQKTSGPPVNVWNVRKEQMSRAATLPQPTSVPSNVTRSPIENVTDSSNFPLPSAEPPRSDPKSQKRQQLNGHDTSPTPVEQPAHSKPAPPITQDLESWPTVGSSVHSASAPPRDPGNANTGTSDISKTENPKEAPVSVPKKGEKQKWISIPPEELRAVADALRPSKQSHSRPRSQQVSGQATASGSGSVSRSGHNSQHQSRTHSAAGIRQTTSHSGSAAHSQSHSRTGSVHSSPRQPSIRGGRRLPEDRANGSINRSARSSRATSPQRQIRNQVIHSQPHVLQPVPSDGDASQHPRNIPHEPAFYEPTPAYGYYPALPPSSGATRTHSYQSTHATNSPASHPYSLPYPASPSAYPPGPYPGPPYHMYPPYPYPYNPYMHWGPSQEHPAHLYATGPMVPPGSITYPQPSMDPTSPDVAAGIPPPTMISRPPPPGQSDAVAGYRDVGFVLPPPATYGRQEQNGEGEQGDGRQRQISFGSIDVATSQSPSSGVASPRPPSLAIASGTLGLDVNGAKPDVFAEQTTEDLGIEKPFTAFAIGVTPDDTTRSRSRSKTAPVAKVSLPPRERIETAPAVLSTATSGTSDLSSIGIESSALRPLEEQNVIDLTESRGTKWEFGTANSSEEISTQMSIAVDVQQQSRPENLPPANGIPVEGPPPVFVEQSSQQPIPQQYHMGYAPFIPPPAGVSLPNSPPMATSSYPPSTVAPTISSPSRSSDDFQVKNFGYGFGRGVAPGMRPPHPGPPPASMEDPRATSPREYQLPHGGRPRRGSYGGGFGYERGGHSMRRGRGYGGGRGSGRNIPRGGGGGNFQHHQHHQNQHQKPPFTVMTPPQPQQLPPVSESPYYPHVPQPHISGTTYYHPVAYETYYAGYAAPPLPPHLAIPPPSRTTGPPLPSPITRLPYRIDDHQYHLLGQLEYYLSAENLARDFWLRKQMDSHGWLSISLIASFNRVKLLTADVQLVRDALAKSSLVELRDHEVRVHDWKQYVVPDASRSIVDGGFVPNASSAAATFPLADTNDNLDPSEEEGEEDDIETEDDDVEFVLGKDANRSWTPERPTV